MTTPPEREAGLVCFIPFALCARGMVSKQTASPA